MLPLWADILILAVLPVILLVVLKVWGAEEPDNAIVHEQENEKREDPDEMAAVA